MQETSVRRKVISLLSPLNAFAVENPVCPGTPDVCCVAGWLELKVTKWPRRADSRVVVDLRNEQKIWLRKWRKHGGRAWTFTVIEPVIGDFADRLDECFLHDASWSADYLGEVNEDVLRSNALAIWRGFPSRDQLIAELMRKPK